MRSQAAWKRLRPTEPPGKDTVQPVKLPADCAVCSRFPALVGSHPCWDWLWWYSCLSHLFTVTLTYILLSNSNKTQWFAKSDINGICILVYISSPSWVSIGVYVCLPKKKVSHNNILVERGIFYWFVFTFLSLKITSRKLINVFLITWYLNNKNN